MKNANMIKHLEYAIYDVYEKTKNLKKQNYKIWFMFDKSNNVYWAITDKINNCKNFNINVFKFKLNYEEFSFNNSVAETNCSLKNIDNKNIWFIDEIFTKNPSDQRKGLGSKMIDLVQILTNDGKDNNELAGILKVFTSDKTVNDLKSFYLRKGFNVYNIDKVSKTAILRKEIKMQENEKLLENVIDGSYNDLKFNVVTPKEHKKDIQSFLINNLSQEKQ